MVNSNFLLGNNATFDPSLLGLFDTKQQTLQAMANQFNAALKNKDPAALQKLMGALSLLPAEDLMAILGMIDPAVIQQLMDAMNQSSFGNGGGGGGGGGGGNNRGTTVGSNNKGTTAATTTPGAPTKSTASAQGTPNVAGAKNLTAEQKANAKIIIDEGKKAGASPRDIQIALMTAMQESNLRNLKGGDRDSAGLFQQRPSQGWGSLNQVTDPHYSSAKFYKHLLALKNRDNMSLTQAAQAVQRSAYPNAYAKWEGLAAGLMQELGS